MTQHKLKFEACQSIENTGYFAASDEIRIHAGKVGSLITALVSYVNGEKCRLAKVQTGSPGLRKYHIGKRIDNSVLSCKNGSCFCPAALFHYVCIVDARPEVSAGTCW